MKMTVSNYLDCGCAIYEDGTRAWCPTCISLHKQKEVKLESGPDFSLDDLRSMVPGSKAVKDLDKLIFALKYVAEIAEILNCEQLCDLGWIPDFGEHGEIISFEDPEEGNIVEIYQDGLLNEIGIVAREALTEEKDTLQMTTPEP